MYNSVREMHIAIDHGLQHISSNRKQSINNYLKDLALNYSVLQFIELRSSGKRTDGKGFESDQKRYDDLKELKRRTGKIATYIQNGLDEVFAIQPDDYYKLIGSTSYIIYNKFKNVYTYDPYILRYKTLSFPSQYAETQTYKNFKLIRTLNPGKPEEEIQTLIDITDYPNFPITYGHDSKFMYVNLVLNKIRYILWERWDDSILYNSFIINDDTEDTVYTLSYGESGTLTTVNSVNGILNVSLFDDNLTPAPTYSIKKNELLSSLYFDNIGENVQFSRNRHRKPISKLSQNRLIIEQGSDFLVPFVDIEYIRKPTLIDHITGKTCELSITREIIDLAIQRLKAYIKDEGYQQVVYETQISE